MQNTYLYLNGRIMPAEEASISPFDIGLLRGYAVFDLLRTVAGRPFLLAEHLQRLRQSADQLCITVPASDDEITKAIDELLTLNPHEAEATVRIVLTGGVSDDGMSFGTNPATLMIVTHDLHEPPASTYETGGSLITQLHTREAPLAKTTNYVTKLLCQDRVSQSGAMDLLYHDGTHITEAASASFYIVRGGSILVPERDVLWGTVGQLVLDAVRDRIPVVVRDVALDEVFSADEAFLTSTTRGILPITRVDDRTIADGRPGPITRELMGVYADAVARAAAD